MVTASATVATLQLASSSWEPSMSIQRESVAAEMETWLLGAWRSTGPSVCLLEGVSGVGKTVLARHIMAQWGSPAVEVSARPDALGLDDLLIDLAEKLDAVGISAMSNQSEFDLRAGLIDSMRENCLIVLEDFENLIDSSTQLPPKAVVDLVRSMTNQGIQGRVLIVSAQSVGDGPWLEGIERRRLASPTEENAVEILGNLLSERCLESEVSENLRRDVVRWLGCNPRAMRALVGCLADEPLEDLIEFDSDAWDLRDQAGSPELVRKLELYFIDRIFRRLDSSAMLIAELLSVYRKPFTREAIERLDDVVASASDSRDILTSCFLLERNRRWYSLHPVARELARSRLLRVPRRLTTAHRRAADHFVRHFKSSTPDDRPAVIGGAFAEARYHLLKCGAESEFESVASDYRRQLVAHYGRIRKVPESQDERAQLLALLGAILLNGDEGHHLLRGLFANLLVKRGRPEDKIVALRQVTIATKVTKDLAHWYLRLQLAWQLEGITAGRAAARQALEVVNANSKSRVYHYHASMLYSIGQSSEALNLLDEGIEAVPEATVYGLYSLRSFILCRGSRFGEAIENLLAGFRKIGSGVGYSYRLFEQALVIAEARREQSLIRTLRSSVDISTAPDLARFADIVLLKSIGKFRDAAELAAQGLQYPAIAAQAIFCWLCCREVDKASEVAGAANLADNMAVSWLKAVLAVCEGKPELYAEELRKCVSDNSSIGTVVFDERSWLRVWFDLPEKQSIYPSFYFPRLPADLTGLDFDIDHSEDGFSGVDATWWSEIRLPRATSLNGRAGAEITEISTEIQPAVLNLNPIFLGDTKMSGDSYETRDSQVGAMGRGASSVNSNFVQTNSAPLAGDLSELARELNLLREAMKSSDGNIEGDIAIGEIAQASMAAAAGDEETTKGHLAKAGGWALGVANSIGAAVAAAAIKTAIGM